MANEGVDDAGLLTAGSTGCFGGAGDGCGATPTAVCSTGSFGRLASTAMPAVVSLAIGNLVLNWGEGVGKVRNTGAAEPGASVASAGSAEPSTSPAGRLPA